MQLDTWDQKLAEQQKRDFKNYLVVTFGLDAARINEAHSIPGDLLYVNGVSSDSAAATVRFNRSTNDAVELKLHTKIETVFTSIFITNTAQAGESIELIIGINFDIENLLQRSEVQQVLNLTHANPDTNVAAAAHPCNSAIIKADLANIQTAWIDFGVAAVQNNCYPLDPGEWIKVSISNTDQINANFEVGSEIVYITYEV